MLANLELIGAWMVFILALLTCLTLIAPLLKGPPFMPTQRKTLPTIVQLLDIQRGDCIADLGSGDGRLAIAIAEQGAYVVGFELNPLLVYFARWRIRRRGLSQRITIYNRDFWASNWGQFDGLTLYGCHGMMNKLERKIAHECPQHSKIVTNTFALKQKRPKQQKNGVFRY